jgi:competence transcription factor ComK
MYFFNIILLLNVDGVFTIVVVMIMNYIKRSTNGIEISHNGTTNYLKIGIRSYIDKLCIDNLSTFEGRIDAAKKKFNIKHKVPIYVDKNCILFSTRSIRDYDVIYFNYFEIIEQVADGDNCVVYFKDGTYISVNQSYKVVRKQILKTEYILGNL